MNTLALFPSVVADGSTDAQCTPRDLALALNACNPHGHFGTDPCSNPRSHIAAHMKYALEHGDDGLAEEWIGSAFVNGPYSDPLPWCERLRDHPKPWCALWKLDTTTEWFSIVVRCKSTWAPFRKRLRYERPGNIGSADFASFLVWRDWEPSKAVLSLLWTPRKERR